MLPATGGSASDVNSGGPIKNNGNGNTRKTSKKSTKQKTTVPIIEGDVTPLDLEDGNDKQDEELLSASEAGGGGAGAAGEGANWPTGAMDAIV